MFTKLHDRRIPKVRVGVGPVEFQLNVGSGNNGSYSVYILSVGLL